MEVSKLDTMCYTRVCIEGRIESLKAVARRFNDGKRMETDVFAPLGLSADYLMCTDCWDVEVIRLHGKSYLSLWLAIPEHEDYLFWQQPHFLPGVYYMTDRPDQYGYLTNDIDRRVFKDISVVLLNDTGEEIRTTFENEEEAVCFIKGSCRQIPDTLETVDQIFDFFDKREHEDPRAYIFYGLKECCPIEIGLVCAPMTTRIIQCLYDAVSCHSI